MSINKINYTEINWNKGGFTLATSAGWASDLTLTILKLLIAKPGRELVWSWNGGINKK